MSKRSFSDLKQSDWIRACKKLGLTVETASGKGSHILVKHPQVEGKYTVQHSLHKFANMRVFKKLLEWGFDEEDVWNALYSGPQKLDSVRRTKTVVI